MSTITVEQALRLDSRAGVARTQAIEVEVLIRVPIGQGIPMEVALGWLQAQPGIPLARSGWVPQTKTLRLEGLGINGIVHRWTVRAPSLSVIHHAWRVLPLVQPGAILHRWSVRTESGGTLRHLWRVIAPQIVALRAQDVQLPYATLGVTVREIVAALYGESTYGDGQFGG